MTSGDCGRADSGRRRFIALDDECFGAFWCLCGGVVIFIPLSILHFLLVSRTVPTYLGTVPTIPNISTHYILSMYLGSYIYVLFAERSAKRREGRRW